jgi:hypothetical protein
MDKNLNQLENGTPLDKIIVLKCVYKTKSTVEPAFDPNINWYAGVKRLSEDDKKNYKYYIEPGETRITLEDGIEFDLSNEVDKINWEWVKQLPQVADSFEAAQKTPSAEFYVHMEGREARKRNNQKDFQFKAENYVRSDSPVNYEDRALLLGFDMSGEHPESLRDFLTDMARKSPLDIIQLYESKSISIKLLFLKSKKKGVITKDKNIFQYGDIVLGINEKAALAFLMDKDNKEVLELLNKQMNPELYARKKKETNKEVSE